jgi:hypothetical protein
VRITTLLCGLLLVPAAAFGNGATYGGSGGNIYPVYNAEVSMPEEHVRLTIDGDDAGTVSFDCTFHLVNHGGPSMIPMGFPLVLDGWADWAEPDSATLDFQVDVDGEPIVARRAKDGDVLLFGVDFGGRNERTVHVTYTLPWSWADMSLYPASMTYVLRTGGLWRDPIGHGIIEVVSGSSAPLVAFTFDPPPTSFEAGVARWEFRNLRPEKDITIHFSPGIAEAYEGRFGGPYDFQRLPPHRAARELLELVDGEWQEYLGGDWAKDAYGERTQAADSARAARILLEDEARMRVLTPIEALNLEYARAIERACTESRDGPQLAAALAALRRRFW